ncbi:trihelix protein [Tanacetum coccineum]
MSGNGIIISGNGGDTKPPRKFPPLCWSQEEALVLIQAYRDRWHALRRGCLRTADWDAVAEDVGRICPGATPPKTSAQCRHKMEKLRQRYRVEKQRELSFGGGGQFVSNWFYFEAMESLERNDEIEVVGSGSGYSGSGYSSLNPGRGIRFKPNAASMGSLSNNSNVRVSNYVTQVEDNDNDEDNDEEFEDGYYETPINKNLGKTQSYAPRYRELEHLGARPRKVMKTSYGYWNGNEEERGSGYGERNGRSFAGYGESEKRGVKISNDDDDDDDNDGDDDPMGKLVSSIKVLADGFVKMEKMKMDMVREIETMRMEAEMKRNEMLLESQRQMVAAFVKGLAENKK